MMKDDIIEATVAARSLQCIQRNKYNNHCIIALVIDFMDDNQLDIVAILNVFVSVFSMIKVVSQGNIHVFIKRAAVVSVSSGRAAFCLASMVR